MQWQPLNTNCGVEVNIQFLNKKDIILGNKTGIAGNQTYFCTIEYGNASSVIIWATFNNITGDYSLAVPLGTTTTTATSPTSAAVTTSSKGNTIYEVNEIE